MKQLLKKIVWFIFAAPFIYLLIIWPNLPAKVPLHYSGAKADRYGSPTELLILILVVTAISIGVYLLLINVHRIDPKRRGSENKDRLAQMAFGIAVFISAVACLIIYSAANQVAEFNQGLIFSGIGLLFCFLGNYMYNIKPNYFAGFRLPWTLENEDNWRKTHHLAGKLWFAGGIVLCITCLFLPFKTGLTVFIVIIIILSIIPAVYSYRLYKEQKNH
jgi:uncharacterized membrane protein